MAKNSLALSDQLVQLLSAADKRNGLPAGTMFSVMQQEIGGQNQYLDNPTLPHYPNGVAPNGKKSSAFGPFGILESTGKNPGYGVAPLKDKSLEEQVRFASDYLAGRTRAAGGDLTKGLAGYGEGAKYAAQVTGRMGSNGAPILGGAPVVAAANGPAVPVVPVASNRDEQPWQVNVADYNAVDSKPVAADAPVEDPWNQLQVATAAAMAERFKPAEVPRASAPVQQVAPVNPYAPQDFMELLASDVGTRPNFEVFQGLTRLGRRPA